MIFLWCLGLDAAKSRNSPLSYNHPYFCGDRNGTLICYYQLKRDTTVLISTCCNHNQSIPLCHRTHHRLHQVRLLLGRKGDISRIPASQKIIQSPYRLFFVMARCTTLIPYPSLDIGHVVVSRQEAWRFLHSFGCIVLRRGPSLVSLASLPFDRLRGSTGLFVAATAHPESGTDWGHRYRRTPTRH